MWNQSTADWASQNPIIPLGKQVYDNVIDKFKVGDGLTTYNSLPYLDASFGVSQTIGTTTGTAAITLGTTAIYTITPTGTLTINGTNNPTGVQGMTIYILVGSNGSSYAITFGTSFKSTGTLSTGTDNTKHFIIQFFCADGSTWYEVSRTTAM